MPRRPRAAQELAGAHPESLGNSEKGHSGTATRARTYEYEAPAALATGAPILSSNPRVRTFSSGSPNVTLFEPTRLPKVYQA